MHDKNSRLPGEGLFTILLAIASIFLTYKAFEISGFEALSAPGTFPMAVAAVMLVTSVLIAARTIGLPRSTVVTKVAEILPWRVLFMIVMIGLYAFAVQPIGFLPTSFVFLLVSIQVLKGGNILGNAAIAALSLLLVYVVFRLIFSVLMPEGIVPEREIIAWFRNLFAGGAE